MSKTNVIGIRKAINANERRYQGLSTSCTSPNISAQDLEALERRLCMLEPLVVGELHESGLKILRSKRNRDKLRSVNDMLEHIDSFRLVRFERIGPRELHCVPVYRACAPEGNFTFYNIPWQSGGDGPVITYINRNPRG